MYGHQTGLRMILVRTLAVASVAVVMWAALGAAAAAGGVSDWPREIVSSEAKIVAYQPQPDQLNGNLLSCRMAVSVTLARSTRPALGVVWVIARLATDRDTRMARLDEARVTRSRFPAVTPKKEKILSGLINAELPKWYLFVSLDQLVACLDPAQTDEADSEDLATAPPRIIYKDQPAVLVSIDGAVVLRPIEHSSVKRVVNTPFLMVFDPWTQDYFLDGGALWYRTSNIMGMWKPTSNLPAPVAAIAAQPAATEPEQIPAPTPESGPLPLIIVTTEPSELIATRGAPQFAPLVRGQLDYVTNTESDILRDRPSKQYFVLLSGRWYRGPSLNGPWSNVQSSKLPEGFKKIPDSGPKARLLAHVAGTVQASEAVAEAWIPQTSAIRRSEAHLEVRYDGEPQFEEISGINSRPINRQSDQPGLPQSHDPGSDSGRALSGRPAAYHKLEYATNSDSWVIRTGDKYYCCDAGVWFVSHSSNGPWAVADEAPEQVYGIPPASPLYNLRYVHIYGSDSEVVYTGYTSGYVCSYTYDGTVVYGTGYRYEPWNGAYHVPRPATWGFGARYDPRTGKWGLAAGGHSDWFSFAPAWPRSGAGRGWFGPADYFAGSASASIGAGDLRDRAAINIYNRRANLYRNLDINRIPAYEPDKLRRIGSSYNEVFAGPDGDVYRKTAYGWRRAGRLGWILAGRSGSARHSGQRRRAASFDRKQLDREVLDRRRGVERTEAFARETNRSFLTARR